MGKFFKRVQMRAQKELFLAGVLIFYSGCASKSEKRLEQSFSENVLTSGVKMQKTQKVELTQDKEVKVMVTATYLNPEESFVDERWRVNEKFIIGLYEVGHSAGTLELMGADQNLTINLKFPPEDEVKEKEQKAFVAKGGARAPIVVKKLSQADPLLANIPLVNNWNTYFYVEFPHSPKNNFSLSYQNKIYGIESQTDGNATYKKYQLNFTKQAKYITSGTKLF